MVVGIKSGSFIIFFLPAKRYSDKLVPFLVQKFEQKDEKIRISALIVMKHMINSCDEEMANKKQLVLSGLRLLLNETSNRVFQIE